MMIPLPSEDGHVETPVTCVRSLLSAGRSCVGRKPFVRRDGECSSLGRGRAVCLASSGAQEGRLSISLSSFDSLVESLLLFLAAHGDQQHHHQLRGAACRGRLLQNRRRAGRRGTGGVL